MQFEFTDPQTEFERLIGGHYSINAFGPIEVGDADKFRDFLVRSGPPPRTTVYINSNGGDVEEAIAIGRLVRDAWFSTSIGVCALAPEGPNELIAHREWLPGRCMSAATLIFLGGRLRYFPDKSEFGVHQFSFRNPSPDNISRSQILSAKIGRYIADMGVSADFLEYSSSTQSTGIRLIDETGLIQMAVVTGGETDVKWTVQARAKMIYVRGERDSLYGHHKVILGHVKAMGFHFMAVIEAQGRESELTTFGLVEIVLNDEEDRIDISDRCQREVNGIYVNVIARISAGEARQIAYSNSFGIQIRASGEAPMFLGIAPMNTNGGTDELNTFFDAFSVVA